ncbi:MAG TPA: exopolyphosphatase [Pseudomonadales bacterium]|nr:exopolyphosphatase [Pseudomonadales bacterium]
MSEKPFHDHELVAAIDMGSNSFHMAVARVANGEVRIVERLAEKVQLGAGLDKNGRLTEEAQQRALDCLNRFNQRIVNLPKGCLRVVGTNALRVAVDSEPFLLQAEKILGYPIDVIAGREEARLIYLGVAHSLSDDEGKRLVLDIGGGSTEFIIGERFEAQLTESLEMGCVTFTQRYFQNGKLSNACWDRAVTAAEQELLSIERSFRAKGWQSAVGASGTVKAIEQVVVANHWTEEGIDFASLKKLKNAILKFDHIDKLDIPGLRDERKSVFTAGVAILYASFERLHIQHMNYSDGALREGVLYDLLGRLDHEDVRDRTIQALMARYAVDTLHAQRVEHTALDALAQAEKAWGLENPRFRDLLRWAALTHEVGLSIAHSQYHKHGAYILHHSDLAGFSRQDQIAFAALVRGHRRKISNDIFNDCPKSLRQGLLRCSLLLRIAAVFHHQRRENYLPQFKLQVSDSKITLIVAPGWKEQHPLSSADFDQESHYFESVGFDFKVVEMS